MDKRVESEIIGLIENSRVAVACSVDGGGFPNAKTMFVRKNEGARVFWFSTNLSAIRTQQWLASPKACVYIFDENGRKGLTLTGYMKVCTDAETKELYWERGDERYYRLGPSDPDYCVLCFRADNGSYMSNGKYLFSLRYGASGAVFTSAYKYDGKWVKE